MCNPLARGDLDTSCSSESSTSLMLARRCAGRTSCNVLVSPIHLTSPCPGTPAYLEVQYTCDTATREEERLARLPQLGTNITGLWNSHERAITQVAIEEAIKRGAAEGILEVPLIEEVGGSEVIKRPEEKENEKIMKMKKDKVDKVTPHRINSPTSEGESTQAMVDDQAVKSIHLVGENRAKEVDERGELAPRGKDGGWAPSSSLPTTVVSGEVSYRTATIITVSTLVSLCCLLSLAWMCGGRWRRRGTEGKAPSCRLSSTSLSDVSSSRPPDSLYHGGHDSQCHCLGEEQHQQPSSTPAPVQPATLDVGGLYDQLSPVRHPPLYSPTPSHCSLPSTAFPPSPRPYSPHYKQPSSPSVSQCPGLHLPRSPDPHSHTSSPSTTLALPGTSMAIASTTTHLALPDTPSLSSGTRMMPGGGLAIQCSVSYLVGHPRAPSRLQCDV